MTAKKTKTVQLSALMALLVLMVGCASHHNYTAADGTIISTARSVPERMIDAGIERQALKGLGSIDGLTKINHRVAIKAFRGEVLLTGEVPNESVKQSIENMVRSIREVKEVFNYLTIADTPKSQSHTVHENYLKTKIMSKLVTKQELKSSQYYITVRNDIAYVMGYLTKEQQDLVIDAIVDTDGMAGLYLLSTLLATEQDVAEGVLTGMNTQDPQAAGYQVPSQSHAITQPDSNPQSSYVQLYQNTDSP